MSFNQFQSLLKTLMPYFQAEILMSPESPVKFWGIPGFNLADLEVLVPWRALGHTIIGNLIYIPDNMTPGGFVQDAKYARGSIYLQLSDRDDLELVWNVIPLAPLESPRFKSRLQIAYDTLMLYRVPSPRDRSPWAEAFRVPTTTPPIGGVAPPACNLLINYLREAYHREGQFLYTSDGRISWDFYQCFSSETKMAILLKSCGWHVGNSIAILPFRTRWIQKYVLGKTIKALEQHHAEFVKVA